MIHFDELVEGKLFVFFLEITICMSKDVRSLQLVITAFQGATDLDLTGFNLAFQISFDAFLMKNVPALEYSEKVSIYLTTTNRTFPTLCFSFLCFYLISLFFFFQQFLQSLLVLQQLLLGSLLSLPLLIEELVVHHDIFEVACKGVQESLNPVSFLFLLTTCFQ